MRSLLAWPQWGQVNTEVKVTGGFVHKQQLKAEVA